MKLLTGLLLLIAVAASLFLADDSSLPVSASQSPILDNNFMPGELLVGVKKPLPVTVNVAAAIKGARSQDEIPSLGVYQIQLPPDVSTQEAIPLYERYPWVSYAEPNYIVEASRNVPNDWSYRQHGLWPGQSWYYELMDGPAAWDQETGSTDTTIAILDTGIDIDHIDLNEKIVTGRSFTTQATADLWGCNKPAANYPRDDDPDSHGTMVAGIAAAESDNRKGVAGMAWGAKLMPVKVLNCAGKGTWAEVSKGIIYAAEHGADVINLSLGGSRLWPRPCGNTLSAAIDKAVADNVILVASAGNDGMKKIGCPAAHFKVIAVGSSGGRYSPNTRAWFSNWGDRVDVVAPGVGICSTMRYDGFKCGNGTSYSAPLVSGLVALMHARVGAILSGSIDNPNLSNAWDHNYVVGTLCNAAKNLPDSGQQNWDGCGRINMLASLSKLTFFPGISHNGANSWE